MLDVGGHIVFDDTLYPAIQRVVQFVLANRNYELAGVERVRYDVPALLRGRRTVKRMLRRVVRTDRDPRPQHASLFRGIEPAQMLGLRKIRDDDRRFDHYAPF